MLSNMWLEKNNGKIYDKEVTKSDRDGLAARLRNGKISFIFRPYLKDGRRIKMTLGTYPHMTLKDARDKVSELKLMINDGHDPRLKVKAQQFENITAPTLDLLFEQWYERQCKLSRSSPAQNYRTYELHIKPTFGALVYADIKRHAMASHLISLAAVKPEIAKRALGDLRQCIDYHKNAGTISAENILNGITGRSLGVVKGQRVRTLDDGDIRNLYKGLRSISMNDKNKAIIELMLFYGCRGGELRNTRREWIDFEAMTWTVPPEFHKTGRKTKMPLVRPILPEMRHLWDTLIEYSAGAKYLCFAMLSKTEKDTQKQMSAGALESLSLQLRKHIITNIREENDETKFVEMEHFSNHDLRRTARSYWSSIGEWSICEKMLGHKLPGEADVYDRHHYTEQMTIVYRRWWGILKALENGSDKVVPLKQKVS